MYVYAAVSFDHNFQVQHFIEYKCIFLDCFTLLLLLTGVFLVKYFRYRAVQCHCFLILHHYVECFR